jgi:hypothetical protein
MRRAWVWNLDADDELARFPLPYQRPRTVEAMIAARPPTDLLADGDVVLDGAMTLDGEYECAAWCPTPFAVKAWQRAGLVAPSVPSVEILRRVNHRAFALPFSHPDVCARWVATEAQWADWCREQALGPWLFKRPFGYVGRGQRRPSWPLSREDHQWALATLNAGDGFVIERCVPIVKEYALHGWIAPERCTWGTLTEQRVDAQGVWRGSIASTDSVLAKQMREACEPLAERLVASGYVGPFGIDAYQWKNDRDKLQMNFVSELNARYTMGYAVGMAANRRR